jgi:hypothetical protein
MPGSSGEPEPSGEPSAVRFEEGMRVRREVLGPSHVDAARAATTGLDADFQRFITETAWGWMCPGRRSIAEPGAW